MDKFKKVKDDAIEHLSVMCGCDIENSEDGVEKAMNMVFKHGTPKQMAHAQRWASKYYWASCEEWYHSLK